MKKLAVILALASIASAQQKPVVIRNATILTITNGTIQNGTVVIRNGKIAAVGANLATPSDATVIDGTGRYVMPGIIDTHSHAGVEGSVNEISLPNTGMVRIGDVLTNDDVSAYRQLAGGTTAALVLHGSANAIGGESKIVKWKWGRPISEWAIPDAPRVIKFALGENPKSANFRPPEGQQRQYPATRMGVEEVIRDAFTDARDYQARWAEYNEKVRRKESAIPPRKDQLMETMLGILDGSVHVHSHCYRSDEIMMLINLANEMGFKIRTFQHVLEGYKVAREIAAHGAGAGTFIDWWGFKAEAYDATPYNVALMTRNGVVVTTNSDSDELARHLNHDAAKAMKYGALNEEEALRLVTINAARQLGVEKRLGSIEVGKDADLAIWNGHPLSTYSRVEATMVEGEVVFDRQRDLQERERLRAEKERLLKEEQDEEAKAKKTPARGEKPNA